MDRVRTDGVAQEERTRGLGIEVVLVVLDRPARSELTVLEVLDLKRGSDTKGTEIGGTTAIKDEKWKLRTSMKVRFILLPVGWKSCTVQMAFPPQ